MSDAERGNVEPSGIPLHSGDPSWDAFIRRGPKMYQILQRVDLGDVLSELECAALSTLIREHAILTARLESAASPPPAPTPAAGAAPPSGAGVSEEAKP